MAFLNDLAAAFALQPTDPEGALARLMDMWNALDRNDRAGQCILAHYIADLQSDVADELRWDETALEASNGVTDDDLQKLHPTLTVAGFIPSLQLNVADGYRRVGRFEDASAALTKSVAHNDALPLDLPEEVTYREMILGGQQRLADRISRRDTASV
ncbi:hypothetical protein [Smaragdicoccus niigatensis]|uniref:hypothetical protein n=1 Tax=Smaragdicoccus niigatensis TaxID=359359 RepID=UPI00037B1A9F|nr:hypothetical protein [Smaragdicoccus niigatensis]